MLLKVSAAKLPGNYEALALPEVVWSLSSALGGASRDAEMRERSLGRVRGQESGGRWSLTCWRRRRRRSWAEPTASLVGTRAGG